mgnify:FL=1|jgi:branched-chain amino acid transport system permease protein
MRQIIYKNRNWVLLTIVFVVFPLFFANQNFLLTIFSLVLIYSIAALGLNLVIGYAGQISIGHAAFLAIGAYFSAVMVMKYNVPFLIAFLGAGAIAGFFGLLLGIPSLRLRGFYLAIATMAFGVVIEQTLNAWEFVGASVGIREIKPANLFGISLSSDLANLYFVIFVSIVLFVITNNIIKSKTGRALKAIRESSFAAQSLGINVARYKLIAFIISAVYAGFAGSLYAHTIGYISPLDFGLGTSINLLAMIVIGGLASLSGGFIGSIIIIALPFIFSRTQLPMSVIFGVLLILVVLFFPRGIAYGLQIISLKYLWKPYTSFRRFLSSVKKERGEYAEVSGKKIFYRETGDKRGIPIVFVHGNFASGKWFEPVMSLLPGEYRAFAIDLPNFGRSDRVEEVSIDNYGKFVIDFIRQKELEGAILVGHSLGGPVVQSVMVQRPDLIDRVVLIDPGPPDGLITTPEVYAVLNLYLNNRDLLKKSLIGAMPTRKIDRFTEQLVDEALLMDKRCFVENAKALEKYNYSKSLAGCEIPTLVLVGKKDLIITEAMARRFEKIMPNARVEILADYGHSVNVEDPELFCKILLDFVKG